MPRRILSISSNIGLLLTRNDLLAVAGYSVASPRRPQDAPILFSAEHFDAVLIGDSVPPRVRKELIEYFRRHSDVPVLYVYADPRRPDEPLADECVDVSGDPQPLLRAIEHHIRNRGQRDGKAA
ncbi:MAG TPA: hypothetical protein VLA96_00505 [Terriglobales bacterium]|nr:hypothetical protein [Terriglobales bacterium]